MSFTAFRKQLKSNCLFLGFFYFVETDMNGSSHPDHENLLHTIDSRLRASARYGGAGSCFEFCSPIRRGGRPFGGGGNHRIWGRELYPSPYHIWIKRFSWEILFLLSFTYSQRHGGWLPLSPKGGGSPRGVSPCPPLLLGFFINLPPGVIAIAGMPERRGREHYVLESQKSNCLFLSSISTEEQPFLHRVLLLLLIFNFRHRKGTVFPPFPRHLQKNSPFSPWDSREIIPSRKVYQVRNSSLIFWLMMTKDGIF